ncbi:STAS domain-containing protein [Marinobacterium lutimaris]|uniref:Phospholipid transport system transporter-binding protein n=1 Tax=Marinobacterium lutimaris TaxID=568106 RepID=A0A1H6AZ87_9GAMM|nr:STAS domain-containing protein [Marinobacterium lutimaris]SEG53640.1 phospholipid transport system transporter-binding protein [Marinobacterium lutimaris]
MTKVEQKEEGVIAISGDLLFSSVMAVRQQLESRLKSATGQVVLDLVGVSRADSSALALWLTCLRLGERQGFELSLRNIPEGMKSIADLVGLDHGLA